MEVTHHQIAAALALGYLLGIATAFVAAAIAGIVAMKTVGMGWPSETVGNGGRQDAGRDGFAITSRSDGADRDTALRVYRETGWFSINEARRQAQ
jgi:hypothetical protein